MTERTPERKFVEAMRHIANKGCSDDAVRAACEAFAREARHDCCRCCHMTECPDYEATDGPRLARIMKEVFGDDSTR